MKIWERVIKTRLREEVRISANQFGFMPSRSTTEAIHLMRRLIELYRDRKKDLHMVFIDLEKAYDRIPRDLLWRCLQAREISSTYIQAIQDMYSDISTVVKTPGGDTDGFPISIGLHQGFALSPFLFVLVMDELTKDIQGGIPWCMLFADDIVLVDESRQGVNATLELWRETLETGGLRISRSKTEYLHCRFGGQSVEDGDSSEVTIEGVKVQQKETFRYLGSYMQSNGDIDDDISHRIQAGWVKWRSASGVLCDKKIPFALKGKFYKSTVRPALLYGVECWPVKVSQVRRMLVAEMRMLRWMCGVSRKDRIRNEVVRGKLQVASIDVKMREARLRWYGHVRRRHQGESVRRCEYITIGSEKRSRGRPKKNWAEVIRQDMNLLQLSERMTQDRSLWRSKIQVVERR